MWSNKGHIKRSFPFLLFLVFLREENIIYTQKKTCSKHGNKGQTKWLPCLFYIIICLYFALIMYTITMFLHACIAFRTESRIYS